MATEVIHEDCPNCHSDRTEFLKLLKAEDDYQFVTQRQYFCNNCLTFFAVDVERKDKPSNVITR